MVISVMPKKLLQYTYSLVLPRYCRICGAFDMWLCPICLRHARLALSQRCVVCNKKAPNGALHKGCVTRNTIDGMIAVAEFSQIRPIIHDYKYGLIKELAKPLVELVRRYLEVKNLQNFISKKILVPIPLHKSRFRFRGFNQSELLARALAEIAGLKVVLAIERVKKTKPQINLSRDKRESNIEGAFKVSGLNQVSGKEILLVDDVATTGATLNECARVLKHAGAKSVWALVLAHD
jgi:ComF family protein